MDEFWSSERRMLMELAGEIANDIAVTAVGDLPAPADRGWKALGSAGLLGLTVPETAGGGGAGTAEAVIVAEVLGRRLCPVPFLGPVAATGLLVAAGADAELLEAVCAGQRRLTIAVSADGLGPAVPGAGPCYAWDSAGADGVVVVGAGNEVHIVPVDLTPRYAVDLTRSITPVTIPAEADTVRVGPVPPEAFVRWQAAVLALACADLVGVMAGALERAVSYAAERVQFGVPIGSFQAVRHLCANQLIDTESARSVARFAAWAIAELEPADALLAARTAKAHCSRVARSVVEAGIQVHGGMGFTWESFEHVRLRRVLATGALFGDERHQLREIARSPRYVSQSYRDSDEEREFRSRLREWLEPHAGTRRARSAESTLHDQEWHQTLYRGGWLGLSWPREVGGQGLPDVYESILNDEIAVAAAPPLPAELNFLGRAIAGFGSGEQQREFLPAMLSGDEMWCQGFSEPEAGSDLASLHTRAVLDGDMYRVRGQKLWTSGAADARWCLLLARTDDTVAKHKGISALIVDMRSPGITVRPLRTLAGTAEFAEVFFDDVAVPAARRVGPEGAGWALAMTTVAYERGPSDIGYIADYQATVRALGERVAGSAAGPDSATAAEVARRRVDVEVLRLHVLRSLSERMADGAGPRSSIDKVLMSRTEQALAHTALSLAGGGVPVGESDDTLHLYLWSRAASIYGGTEQVQLDILADRVLKLPRSR